jgi:hypothetical protein
LHGRSDQGLLTPIIRQQAVQILRHDIDCGQHPIPVGSVDGVGGVGNILNHLFDRGGDVTQGCESEHRCGFFERM